ncbi:efflux RND transporter periplasmic adaptor subunit [Microbaculum sp. FT89]|uniref:efflux RND transporter periplasmic adaptor subunit n=1 Tax=Microbaculum sp. FT89 TaxID=3447298 RepID=UPI003F53D2ED
MRKSYIWAVVITVAIAGWLASGEVIVGGQGNTAVTEPDAQDGSLSADTDASGNEAKPFRVRVGTLASVDRTAELKVRGRTEAAERVTLRAQTPGLVEEIPVRKGQQVATGDVICKLEAGSRTANILRAEAGLAQAELDHDAASKLNEKGYAAETRVRAAKAAMHAARAVLSEAQLDLERTEIKASFDGVVDDLPAKIGTLLSVGDPCAEIVAADPMLVVAQVSERDVGRIAPGMAGSARLVTGDTAEGTLRFVATSADEATRTFRIELSVSNPDGRLRDGVTAEIAIPLETTKAHRFSPAILTLDDKGVIGVRTLTDGNRVAFMPVQILGNEDGTVWVSGLPDTVTIITVGQDYVKPGERVEPVFETASTSAQTGNASQ